MQELTALDCETRLVRSRQLLHKYQIPVICSRLFIFFTDEKLFTVALHHQSICRMTKCTHRLRPRNTLMLTTCSANDPHSARALWFQSVCKIGYTGLVCFVEQGTKVNSSYYRGVLLSKQLQPAIRHIAINFYTLQQDTPAPLVHETVEPLRN